jgi:hypothetical protein
LTEIPQYDDLTSEVLFTIGDLGGFERSAGEQVGEARNIY